MAKVLKTSPDNRTCMFPNCGQILSIYNHESYCHVHRYEMAHPPKDRPLALPHQPVIETVS